MPLPDSIIHAIAFMAVAEASYGAGGTPVVATDGIQLAYDSDEGAPLTRAEDFDGSIGANPGGMVPLRMLPPSATTIAGTLPFHLRGPGVAYSATDICSLHNLLLAAGLDATLDATPASEKWTFDLTVGPTGFTSLAAHVLAAQELWALSHLFANWTCSISEGIPVHSFDIVALLSANESNSNAAYTVVYPLVAIEPPKAEAVVFTIGDWVVPASALISVEWDLGRPIDEPRRRVGAAGAHAGWTPGKPIPSLIATVERSALQGSPFHAAGGIDPYRLQAAATQLGVSCRVGTAQYNQHIWDFPQAQLSGTIEPGADGSAGTWQLPFRPFSTTPILNDGFTFVTD